MPSLYRTEGSFERVGERISRGNDFSRGIKTGGEKNIIPNVGGTHLGGAASVGEGKLSIAKASMQG